MYKEGMTLIGSLREFDDFFPNEEVPDKGFKGTSKPKWTWDSKLAYYEEYNHEISRKIRFLEPEFIEWYKARSHPERISWVKEMTAFDVHQEADGVYEEYSDPETAEKRRRACIYVEGFIHWCNYAYLIEEVNEAINKGWDHDQYVSNKLNEEFTNTVEDMRGRYGFVLDNKEISDDAILSLSHLYRFLVEQSNYDFLMDRCPGYVVEKKARDLRASYEGIKRSCTEQELKAANIAYDAYLERQKTKENFSEQEQKVFPVIKEAYETWNSLINKKNEIYKKGVRMAGAGFSKS